MVRNVEPAYGLNTPYTSFIIEVQAVLAAGSNVLFVYQGEVISVLDSERVQSAEVEVLDKADDSELSGLVAIVVSLIALMLPFFA